MKHLKKFAALFLSMALVAVSLAGCGGGSGSATSSNSGASTSAPAGNASSDGAITIRYGSADAEDSAIVQGIYAFKEYVEDASGGSIKVDTYINGVLGGDRELTEGLQLGTVDMCVPLASILANYDSNWNIFALPYVWTSKQASYDACDGELGDYFMKSADEIGFKCLGFADGGTYDLGYKGAAIDTYEGFKGMKLRVPEVDVDIDFFTETGSTPTPISFSETYTSIEQGVVDGLELSIELMYASKYFDAIDNITLTEHSNQVFGVLMSQSMWGQLSEEQQKIVEEGVKVQLQRNREVAAQAETEYSKIFTDSGKTIVTLSDEEMSKFVAAGKKIQEKYVSDGKISQELLDMAQSTNK